ncbi:MAG TPA: RAMP superfamily CRISPR-associated protein [Candidatus Brocadiaceae bacterium]|nr:RAMP superfamily CRISPR-associated protein [Candidatus Brocadiaceae bacterium]
MTDEWLKVAICSGATFSAGKGLAGDVDVEIEHEPCGLPIIRGRTLKGLLVEERDAILDVYRDNCWKNAARRLFGETKENECSGILWIGDARLPEKVRVVSHNATTRVKDKLNPLQILSALTDVRQQTRIDRETGAAADGSLRAVRVVLPSVIFYAPLRWLGNPSDDDKTFLSLCVMSVKRGGLARNRGRGKLIMQYLDKDKKPLDMASMLERAYQSCDMITP